MNLKGQIALVTGSSRGIGKTIATELALRGATVIINCSKDEMGAYNTLDEIEDNGMVYKCDVSNFKETHIMIDEIIKKYGKIDILVNNAGVSKVGFMIDMSEEEISEIIDINLKGVINCCHAAVKPMLKQEKGSIINISSIWGNTGSSCEAIYSASKGGVNAFTQALAKELGSSGIRVNAISPGVIDTEMNSFLSKEEKEELLLQMPMRRFGTTEDVSKLVAFLVGTDSGYINGQIITVDGGFM